jgi:hypothetical protein
MRNHRLARRNPELGAIKVYRDDVRLERHKIGDAADLRIGVAIRPYRQTCITDVVVAAQPFVRAEGLVFHGGSARTHPRRRVPRTSAAQSPIRRGRPAAWYRPGIGLVSAWYRPGIGLVSAWYRPGIGNDAVTAANHQAAGGLTNVDAVEAVGGMAHDPFVFFVESVHGRPCERDPCPQVARVGWQIDAHVVSLSECAPLPLINNHEKLSLCLFRGNYLSNEGLQSYRRH